jgi:septal ring factor EnvC (AmiA/AmiB activator)
VHGRVSKPTHGNFCSTSPCSYSGPTRDKVKKDYNKVCADLQRTQDSLQRTQDDLKTVESDIQELRHTNRDLVQDRVKMQDELKKAKREVEEYRKLLGIKERELLDASQRIDQGREDVFESCVSSTT